MATSSFDKDFTLNSKKAVDSFLKIISSANEKKGIKIDRSLITEETKKRGEEKLKKMLSH
ncbi:MAG TPA: hypothetical protein PK466_10865 [Thermotogota bacterium]|nr:hypothetical protein [Thermotogota bacterium]HPJ89623.1 hypothetical protein [Thermotogota bacterium]HPR96826.1 hypothetical protein [Thermotogota bacterium]